MTKIKVVYQAEDKTVFDTEAEALFYQLLEGCQYCYVSKEDRKYLATHLVSGLLSLNKQEEKNETIPTSESIELSPSQS